MIIGTIVGHASCTALAVIGGRYVSTKISVKHGEFVPAENLLIADLTFFSPPQSHMAAPFCSSFLALFIYAKLLPQPQMLCPWPQKTAPLLELPQGGRAIIILNIGSTA